MFFFFFFRTGTRGRTALVKKKKKMDRDVGRNDKFHGLKYFSWILRGAREVRRTGRHCTSATGIIELANIELLYWIVDAAGNLEFLPIFFFFPAP